MALYAPFEGSGDKVVRHHMAGCCIQLATSFPLEIPIEATSVARHQQAAGKAAKRRHFGRRIENAVTANSSSSWTIEVEEILSGRTGFSLLPEVAGSVEQDCKYDHRR